MSKVRPGEVAWNVAIPEEMAQKLRELAARNGRSVQAETLSAFNRHLEAPPTVTVIEDKPPLPAEVVELPKDPPKRRGRKPKA